MGSFNKQQKMDQFMANVEASEDWEEVVSTGMEIREEYDSSQWELGDLAEKVYEKWGSQGVEAYAITVHVPKTTLNRWKDVAHAIPKELREKYNILSFSHFKVAAGRPNPEEVLKMAADNNWSVENLSMQLKKLDGKPVAPMQKVRVVTCQFCRKATLSGPLELICSNFHDCNSVTAQKGGE